MSYQTPVTIKHTLEQIERREIVLPAIQREFVWKPWQICRLFDSLMQGYPFGTFLYWKIKQEYNNRYQFYDFVLNYHERNNPHCPKIGEMPNHNAVAVLDGQQRLTALNIGLRGSMAIKLPYKRWKNDAAFPKRHLYLNLLWSPSEDDDIGMHYQFELLSNKQLEDRDGCWFRVCDVLTLKNGGPAITKWLAEHKLRDQTIVEANEILFRLYEVIRIIPLVSFYEERSQELEKVLQIFIRTNSGGTVLSYSDLLLSVAVAQWDSDAREEIHQLVDDLNKMGSGFSFSKDWVLKAGLMLSDIGSVGFKVDNFNRENMKILEERWSEIKKALRFTVELVSGFGFGDSTLRAESALHPIAYYLYARKVDAGYLTEPGSADDREMIRKWLIASFLKPSGIWGSGLDTLLTALRKVIQECHTRFPKTEIEAMMRSRGKSLNFNDDEIDDLAEIRSRDRRTFSLLSLIFQHLDLRQHFHIDHVFPKSHFTSAKLRRAGLPEDTITQFRESFDRLPNLQLLEGHKNVQKGAMLPAEWLHITKSDEERRNYVATHLLGNVPETICDFDSFYEERRLQLRNEIVELLS